MSKKKITQAVLDANRANAQKSGGPRTTAGKVAASRNAVKDGFFGKELILSQADKREVQSFSWRLHAEHPPTTALQKVGFDRVVYCCGRLKVAARLEMRRASALLDAPDGPEAQTQIPEGTPVISGWYLSGRQDLREALRFLESVIGEFEESRRVREELKEPLDRAFGVGFFDLLTKWTPANVDAVILAEHLQEHARTFRKPLPPLDANRLTKIVIDPAQGSQMVGKLLEREWQHLRDLSASWGQRTAQTVEAHNAVVDFAPRYFTMASRDFHSAIEWYLHLKEKNL